MVAVLSKAFKDVSYDPKDRVLTIIFNDGGVFLYQDLPKAVYEELLAAKSMGSYFNREIRPNYRAVPLRGHK